MAGAMARDDELAACVPEPLRSVLARRFLAAVGVHDGGLPSSAARAHSMRSFRAALPSTRRACPRRCLARYDIAS